MWTVVEIGQGVSDVFALDRRRFKDDGVLREDRHVNIVDEFFILEVLGEWKMLCWTLELFSCAG